MKRIIGLFVALIAYAGIAFAAVNINSATKEQLETLDGIGPVKAQAIIDYRKKNGPFKSLEDVKKVDGVGDATFDKIRKDISLSGTTKVDTPAKAEPKKAEAEEGAKSRRRPRPRRKSRRRPRPRRTSRRRPRPKKAESRRRTSRRRPRPKKAEKAGGRRQEGGQEGRRRKQKKAADEKKAADKKAADEKKAADKKAADEKKAADKKAADEKKAEADKKAADEKKRRRQEGRRQEGRRQEGRRRRRPPTRRRPTRRSNPAPVRLGGGPRSRRGLLLFGRRYTPAKPTENPPCSPPSSSSSATRPWSACSAFPGRTVQRACSPSWRATIRPGSVKDRPALP